MAVGIPGKYKRIAGDSSNEHGVRLEYAGKKPIEDILSFPPSRFEPSKTCGSGANRLYHADNLTVLASLTQDESVAGKVRWYI